MFNFESITDFEKHIALSIPNYGGLCDVFRAFTHEYSHPEGSVLDIGCSTGSFLHSLNKHIDINYFGSDIIDIVRYKDFDFIRGDCEDALHADNLDVIISMFTLQFLGKHKRARVVSRLKDIVSHGSVLLIAEKCIFDAKVEGVIKREHLQQKRKGFSDSEILNKDRELFGAMHCLTNSELLQELNSIGKTVQIWQSYNFKGYIVYGESA
jgi:tRNA (cmo5U34)-methyltransferase